MLFKDKNCLKKLCICWGFGNELWGSLVRRGNNAGDRGGGNFYQCASARIWGWTYTAAPPLRLFASEWKYLLYLSDFMACKILPRSDAESSQTSRYDFFRLSASAFGINMLSTILPPKIQIMVKMNNFSYWFIII